MTHYTFALIGAGMAGASAGYFLAEHGPLLLLEREDMPGYHTTGRSAAIYSETYGNATIRALTSGGRDFFTAPPQGFTEVPLLTPRGALFIGRSDQQDALERTAREGAELVPSVRRIEAAEACALVPVLRQDYVAGAVLEPDATDMDVNAIHQGFLRGLRARGGEIVTRAAVERLERAQGLWRIATSAGEFTADVLINAAGAWGDELAGLASAAPVGLVPKRRTAITLPAPDGAGDLDAWPLTIDVDEQFYFKPEAGHLLASPADETPMPPCDVQPEELDIAILVDRLQQATSLNVPRIERRWAGLRSFVADKSPVVGFDPACEGFFWLVGQGGYGIQTAPSMGRVAAALAREQEVPTDLRQWGVAASALSPARFTGD